MPLNNKLRYKIDIGRLRIAQKTCVTKGLAESNSTLRYNLIGRLIYL